MTFNHPTALDTALFPSTSPPLISTRNTPRSSDLLITTQQYSLLLKLQRRYNSSTDLTHQQPINRREFAIALQSLSDRIFNLQLAISSRDLATIKYLKKAFALELAALPKQEKVAVLPKKTKFSLGTKISGEVLLTGIAIGGKPIEDEDNNDRRVTAGYRARLNINTSFTGFDRLRIRLQNSDIAAVNRVTGSDMSRLSYQGNTNGKLVLNRLEYRFPIDPKTELFATTKGGSLATFGDPLNPLTDSTQIQVASEPMTLSMIQVMRSPPMPLGSNLQYRFPKMFISAVGLELPALRRWTYPEIPLQIFSTGRRLYP